jgi:endogenous inhibitor of DNA gyrase (YacG/DUF329 family)
LLLKARWRIDTSPERTTENQPETTFVVRLPSCPICKIKLSASAATESSDFPFCSERCRQVDLLRWSDGKYAIVEPLSDDAIAEKQLADETDESLDDGY